jgi:hypothetical protein
MADTEVKVGEKVIGENTKITLSVKVAIWIISGIILLFSTAFTVAYFDVKSDVKTYKTQMEKDKSDFIKTVEDKLDEKLGSFQAKDEAFIKEIGDIKGDIKVILDRTGGVRTTDVTINNSNRNKPPGL